MGRRPRVRRDDVLQAAREAFSERGYEGTTLAAIGARLGVSPAALLRHAPSKEALFAQAMAAGEASSLPTDFLAKADGSQDPRTVLRRLAHVFVPFIESKMGESIARWMRARTAEEARTIRLPFDPREKCPPPARALLALKDYFDRAQSAGRLRVRDRRAAALAFLGSLHSYVFLHRVLRIADPPIPLDDYLDTLLTIWERGALRKDRKSR